MYYISNDIHSLSDSGLRASYIHHRLRLDLWTMKQCIEFRYNVDILRYKKKLDWYLTDRFNFSTPTHAGKRKSRIPQGNHNNI